MINVIEIIIRDIDHIKCLVGFQWLRASDRENNSTANKSGGSQIWFFLEREKLEES